MFYNIIDYEVIFSEVPSNFNFSNWVGWVKIYDNSDYYMTYNTFPQFGNPGKEMVIVRSNTVSKGFEYQPLVVDVNKYDIKRASEIIKSYEFKRTLELL